jgi:putative ABC transport system ATP-binding protein
MALIELQDITKHYGPEGFQTTALDNVSLSINEGEFVAIMGPSGSGKSTLMHIIGLLDRPSGGTYHLDSNDVAGLRESRLAQLRLKKIGFVFQSFNLLPRTTALENVMLPMVYAQHTRIGQEKHALELLRKFGLEEQIDHTPAELSGGQMQRVAIARALANKPSLILADEPTGNLDSASGSQVLDLLENLHREGATVILVTHDAAVAGRAKRTIRLQDGTIAGDSMAAPQRSPQPVPKTKAIPKRSKKASKRRKKS